MSTNNDNNPSQMTDEAALSERNAKPTGSTETDEAEPKAAEKELKPSDPQARTGVSPMLAELDSLMQTGYGNGHAPIATTAASIPFTPKIVTKTVTRTAEPDQENTDMIKYAYMS